MKIWDDFKQLDNKKKALYIAIALLILLLLILGGWWLSRYFQPVPEPIAEAPLQAVPVTSETVTPTINPISLNEAQTAQNTEKPVRLVAEPFVERFGSYNNQGDYNNFFDLDFFMTTALRQWVNEKYIPQLKQSSPSIDTYFAVNTRVLSTNIELLDDANGKATLLISTQRQEVGAGNIQQKLYYQDARVELIKEGSDWKISALYWL